MNNSPVEFPAAQSRGIERSDELAKLKKDLLQTEVKLAKARATVTGAEIDIKMLNAKLKEAIR